MSTTANTKRLEKIEVQLTPSEWAIQLADAIRMYPSMNAFCAAEVKAGASVVRKAQRMLLQKAETEHPGLKAEGERRCEVKRVLTDFNTLTNLLLEANKAIGMRIEIGALEVALQTQSLETLICRDLLWSARQTTFTGSESVTNAENDNREDSHVLLGKVSDEICRPLDRSSRMEDWCREFRRIDLQLNCHKAAAALVGDTYFGGHPILSNDNEAELDGVIVHLGEIMDCYRQDFEGQRESEERLKSCMESHALPVDAVQRLANHWFRCAREDAVLTVLNWMGETAERDVYRREVIMRLAGVSE